MQDDSKLFEFHLSVLILNIEYNSKRARYWFCKNIALMDFQLYFCAAYYVYVYVRLLTQCSKVRFLNKIATNIHVMSQRNFMKMRMCIFQDAGTGIPAPKRDRHPSAGIGVGAADTTIGRFSLRKRWVTYQHSLFLFFSLLNLLARARAGGRAGGRVSTCANICPPASSIMREQWENGK